VVLYSSFVAPYYMKWLRNIQIIRIIRIIFRYSNIRIMIFKLWILFVIRFSNFLPTNIIRLFDSLQNDYSWQHWPRYQECKNVISTWLIAAICHILLVSTEKVPSEVHRLWPDSGRRRAGRSSAARADDFSVILIAGHFQENLKQNISFEIKHNRQPKRYIKISRPPPM